MPLRDHFRPPLSEEFQWTGIHAGWPMVITQHLARQLPPGYSASPRVQIGIGYEIDFGARRKVTPPGQNGHHAPEGGGGVAMAVAIRPTLDTEIELAEPDTFEIMIYEMNPERRLVAAIEFLSPSNKHGPEERGQFVVKCAGLLRQGVCVAIVDLVTIRPANLYADLLRRNGITDPTVGDPPSPIYTAVLRRNPKPPWRGVQGWYTPLRVGEPLPPVQIWLSKELPLSVDLETTYTETLQALRID